MPRRRFKWYIITFGFGHFKVGLGQVFQTISTNLSKYDYTTDNLQQVWLTLLNWQDQIKHSATKFKIKA